MNPTSTVGMEQLKKDIHKCEQCGMVLESKEFLQKHQSTCSERRPYVCLVCFVTFESEFHVSKHILLEHPVESEETRAKTESKEADNYQCKICGETFPTKYHALKHNIEHEQATSIECDDCGLTFDDVESLKEHKEKMFEHFSPKAKRKKLLTLQETKDIYDLACGNEEILETSNESEDQLEAYNENDKNTEAVEVDKVSEGTFDIYDLACEHEQMSEVNNENEDPEAPDVDQASEDHPEDTFGNDSANSQTWDEYTEMCVASENGDIVEKHNENEEDSEALEVGKVSEDHPEDTFENDGANSHNDSASSQTLDEFAENGDPDISEYLPEEIPEPDTEEIDLPQNNYAPCYCYQCKKSFSNKSALIRHLRIHNGEKPYQCHICEEGFNFKSKLMEHERTRHNARSQQCEHCNKSFTHRELVIHLRTHTDENQGLRDSSNQSPLNSSTIQLQNGPEKPEKDSRQASSSMVQLRNRSSASEKSQGSSPKHSTKNDDQKKSTVCDLCGNEFASTYSRNRHMLTHSKKKSHGREASEKSSAQHQHLHEQLVHSGKQLECQHCGKTFATLYSLRRHVLTHGEDRNFKCSLCDAAFVMNDYLQKHLWRLHSIRTKSQKCGQDKVLPASEGSLDLKQRLRNRNQHHKQGKQNQTPRKLTRHKPVRTSKNPQHVCKNCNKAFLRRDNLVKHERIHIGKKGFKNRKIMLKHERKHAGKKAYQCKHCDWVFIDRSFMLIHERSHTSKKPFHCTYCHKGFGDNRTKRRHERMHTGEKPYQCKHCGKKFSDQGNKAKHERKHSTYQGPNYKCRVCAKSFITSTSLKEHFHSHEGDTIPSRHADGKRFHCKFRNKGFTDAGNKQRHERTYTGEKPYFCKYCDKEFGQIANKTRHERIHTGEKPYQCKHCDMTFSDPSNMISHQRSHSCERPYVCKYCNKDFGQIATKTRHERMHTGEKPYQCKQCGKKFNDQGNRAKHERMHSRYRGPSYKCDVCCISFMAKTSLKEHLLSHDDDQPFKCSICGVAYSEHLQLLHHVENKHSIQCKRNNKTRASQSADSRQGEAHSFVSNQSKGQKRFHCTHCDKGFTERASMRRHERTHTGEKPYQCKHCDKKFSDQGNKAKHERRHRGKIGVRKSVARGLHQCGQCKKTFIGKAGLMLHKRLHNGVNKSRL